MSSHRTIHLTHRVWVSALGLALGLACARGEEAPAPVADAAARRAVETGELVGFVGDYGSHVWLGIPYATPPVGELRWRAPRPAQAWMGPRESLAFSSPCPQFATPLGGLDQQEPGTPAGDEDCLYLNVYTPVFPAGGVPQGDARLPVMVWIHGGGNVVGHAGFYDGGNLAASQDVVVVTTHYRLGPFGWFRHPALPGEGASALDVSGNYGTLDLVQTLQWVQRNIASFGGEQRRLLFSCPRFTLISRRFGSVAR